MSFLQFYIKNPDGELRKFPAPTSKTRPVISWDLPDGIEQVSFCLELKTRFQVKLSTYETGFAYYSSGLVRSQNPEHEISLAMLSSTWAGPVEVRLRLFDAAGRVIYSTHDPGSIQYSFEPSPQGYLWDSRYDGYYFVVDYNVESISNTVSPLFGWRNSIDVDLGQAISYQLQWSNTPLFDEGFFHDSGLAIMGEEEEDQSGSLRTESSSEILIRSSIFYRVRAFDGLDYGKWSRVNGFIYSPSARPTCFFNWVTTNCTSSESNPHVRPNGEILISFRVRDQDSKLVSVYLSFVHGGMEKPLSLDSSLVMVRTNEDVVVAWPSARQIVNSVTVITLKMSAFDGENMSDAVQYEYPVLVNNVGIGYGTGDVGGEDLNYRIGSKLRGRESWIQIPDVKALKSASPDGESYLPRPLPSPGPGQWLIGAFNWGNYWSEKLGSSYSSHKFWIGEIYDQVESGKIMRPYFGFYDGFDDQDRNWSSQLLLQYRDEFEVAKEEGESFSQYLQDNIRKTREWCESQSPPIYYPENQEQLGKSVDNVSFFLPEALYGKSIRIRGSKIVRAGTSGLYYDGMVLENRSSGIFKSTDSGAPGSGWHYDQPSYPDGVAELKQKELWKYFYQVDRMYDPKGSQQDESQSYEEWEQQDRTESTIVGPSIADRFDGEQGWYWQLFEYGLKIHFPLTIDDSNKNFAYMLNGKSYRGTLADSEIRIEWSNSIQENLRSVIHRLLPQEIFKPLESSNVEIDSTEKSYRVNMFSRWIDSNRTFRFIPVENSCYEMLGIDLGLRTSQRIKVSSYGYNFILNPQNRKAQDKIEFDIQPDSGDWIGKMDELEETEPLFTCDIEHVNSNGCHFKYTPERFALHGKIYIRKYEVVPVFYEKSNEAMRPAEPGETSVPVMGWCDFILEKAGVNELGDVLYKKRKTGSLGGLPAKTRSIDVLFEGEQVVDRGWWLASQDLMDDSMCLSHELDSATGLFKRRSPQSFIKKIGFLPCFTAKYVDADEGWEKPLIDQAQGGQKLNRRQPVLHYGEIPVGYVQYVLGAYEPPVDPGKITLTEEQAGKGITGEDLAQREEISSYDSKFTSSVYPTSDPSLSYERFNSSWSNAWSSTEKFEKIRTVVDPFLICPGGRESSIMKYGYQPEITLVKYFKEDESGIWKNRLIPPNSNYVHKIYRAEEGEQAMNSNLGQVYHGSVIKDLKLLPDSSKVELPPEEGTKGEYLDYPLRGSTPFETKNYFSSLPVEESEEYLNRPIGPYGEDRPTRISGYIDSLSQLVPWRFIYLQTSWNTYNLVHWEGNQDENIYAKIEVARIINNETGPFMTLQSRQGEWFDRFKCWLIPFKKLQQSMHVDTLNGEFLEITEDGRRIYHRFEDGKKYRFRVSGVNINSGSSTSPVQSDQFTYSRSAYSPPVVLGVEHNKWTGQFKITFRLDDSMGRKYDITKISYAIYGQHDQAPPLSVFQEIEINNIIGATEDLDSNTMGDNVINESRIIKHSIWIPSGVLQLSSMEGKLIRFKLDAVPSEDREGLTMPVFNFRMWPNELLRSADRKIAFLAGHANQWVLEDHYDEDGGYGQVWRYLPISEAVYVPGKLELLNRRVYEIDSKFEDWYAGSAVKFDNPGFDARHSFLLSEPGGDSELYLDLAEDFIAMERPADADHPDPWSYSAEWAAFKSENPSKTEKHLAPLFIESINETNEFNFYWDNFGPLKINVSTSRFNSWWNLHRVIGEQESRELFLNLEEHRSSYLKFLEDEQLTDSDSSRTLYITTKGLAGAFDHYARVLNNYHDSRFSERASFIEENYQTEFSSWKTMPENGYGDECEIYLLTEDLEFIDGKTYYVKTGSTYSEATIAPGDPVPADTYYEMNFLEDDLMILFLASSRVIWESFSAPNQGKQDAKSYFLSMSVNGVTYGQQLQTTSEEISICSMELMRAYEERLYHETNHRKKLVLGGYFSNGWKNNEALLPGGGLNDVFRFRVVNQPSTGKENREPEEGITSDIIIPVAGYDTRWEVYFRWQMDLHDSFDSQSGRPMRDFLYMRADLLGYSGSDAETWMRIHGAIEADSGGMSVLPGNVYTPTDASSKIKSPTTDDPYSYQLSGRFALLKTDLPGLGQHDPFSGTRTVDVLPENWSSGESRPEDDWNQVYFWRVCPYNLVKRPLMEREFVEADSPIQISSQFWKITCRAKIFGNHGHGHLHMENGYYDYEVNKHKNIWLATALLSSPVWKKDSQSQCHSSIEGCFSSFFNGTDSRMMDLSPDLNSVKSSFMERVLDGEMVFLTDRPRKLEDGALSFVEDGIGHFNVAWLPLQSTRSKIWVTRDEEDLVWRAVSHKRARSRSGSSESAIILSMGLSPNSWGDVCQVAPSSSLERPSDVVQGARSFENPCMIKINEYTAILNAEVDGTHVLLRSSGFSRSSFGEVELASSSQVLGSVLEDGSDLDLSQFQYAGTTSISLKSLHRTSTWHVYFNVIKDGIVEVYRTSSGDLMSWSKPVKISIVGNALDPAVYFDEGNWSMLAVHGSSIKEFNSSDGLVWVHGKTIYTDQYNLERPTLADGRVYFGLKTTYAEGLTTYGKIYSIEENGDVDTLRIEKGNPIPDLNESTLPTPGDVWFQPFVFNDRDKGLPVLRMCYMTEGSAWAYSGGAMTKTTFPEGRWNTEYLEKYSWEKCRLNREESGYSYWSSTVTIDGEPMPIIKDENGDKVNINQGSDFIPAGGLEIIFKSIVAPKAVKIPFYVAQGLEDMRSEGEWIDFSNVGATEAWLNPEDGDPDYDRSSLTEERYLIENDLFSQYVDWFSVAHPGDPQSRETMIEFLLATRRYSLYLKWSMRGPGIYRHLFSVQQSSYWGSGDQ